MASASVEAAVGFDLGESVDEITAASATVASEGMAPFSSAWSYALEGLSTVTSLVVASCLGNARLLSLKQRPLLKKAD